MTTPNQATLRRRLLRSFHAFLELVDALSFVLCMVVPFFVRPGRELLGDLLMFATLLTFDDVAESNVAARLLGPALRLGSVGRGLGRTAIAGGMAAGGVPLWFAATVGASGVAAAMSGAISFMESRLASGEGFRGAMARSTRPEQTDLGATAAVAVPDVDILNYVRRADPSASEFIDRCYEGDSSATPSAVLAELLTRSKPTSVWTGETIVWMIQNATRPELEALAQDLRYPARTRWLVQRGLRRRFGADAP